MHLTPARTLMMLVLLCLVGMATALAQDAAPETVQAPPEVPDSKVIPTAQIIDRALETAALLRRADNNSAAAEEVRSIGEDFVSREQDVETLREETLRLLATDGAAAVIAETEKEWLRVQIRYKGWLRTLESRADSMVASLEEVRAEKDIWMLTRDSAAAEEMPPELARVMHDTIESIDLTEQRVRSARDSILDLQAGIGQAMGRTEAILEDQRRAKLERSRGLTEVDSLDLWAALKAPGVDGSITEQTVASWHPNYASLRTYIAEQRTRLLWYLFALLVLTAGLLYLRLRGRIWVKQDQSLRPAVSLLERPVAASIIITAVVCRLTDPSAPSAWHGALGLLMLLAVLRILPQAMAVENRRWAYILAGLFFFQQMARLAPHGTLLSRLVLLVLSLAGCAASIWLLQRARKPRSDITPGWLRFIRFVMWGAALLFLTGALGNILGNVRLSVILVTGTLNSLLSAIVLLATVALLQAMVRVVMLLPSARALGIVSQRGDTTRQTLFRATRAAAVVTWVTLTLSGFMVLGDVLDFLTAIAQARIPLGKMTLTPGDLLVFALAIWISFKIAGFLSFVLEADILPHMRLPRGVPGAMTRLTRYAVIVIGVIVAFSVAGFPVDKITIVFGALGVGVGFGLQNIVNNFVSGLILLFERPIKVGDVIQLATFEGTVIDIGIRASIVRTWSGAEVVVPNANLVSAEVVNWTLRDHRRRVEIPIGVAYGTDPESVISLLEELAAQHPDVFENPRPQAIFQGFGDSSLDFELRAWSDTEHFLGVCSDLRVSMIRALEEAGISIPFPQRDLHIQPIDDGILNGPRGEAD